MSKLFSMRKRRYHAAAADYCDYSAGYCVLPGDNYEGNNDNRDAFYENDFSNNNHDDSQDINQNDNQDENLDDEAKTEDQEPINLQAFVSAPHELLQGDQPLRVPAVVDLSAQYTWLHEYFENQECAIQIMPYDHNKPFDKTSKNNFTKGQFANDFYHIVSQHGIKTPAVNAILELLDKYCENLDLPVKRPLRYSYDAKEKIKITGNNIASYVKKDNRNYVIDVCRNDCMAFHGMQYIKGELINCAVVINCLFCGSPRYTHCTHVSCKNVQYDMCNPFQLPSASNKCHSKLYRKQMKVAYFRPLIPKFLEMYRKSLIPGNENYLKYHLNDQRVVRDNCIIDMCDGSEVKLQYELMHELFKKKAAVIQAQTQEPVEECSILYTIFHDGATNFERAADSMWPMMISVLNSNPSHRSTIGEGMCLGSLHNMKLGSGAEQYILSEIIVHEMVQLEEGVLITTPHPAFPGKFTRVFLQARCIYAHLDTIALQKFFKIMGSGSLIGCVLCKLINGTRRKGCLNKTVYEGSRAVLHADHDLRNFGENAAAGEVYQHDHYSGGELSKTEFETQLDKAKFEPKGAPIPLILPLPKNTTAHGKYNPMDNDANHNRWCNNEFPLSDFAEDLWYPVRDKRVKTYVKTTTQQVLQDGKNADEKRAAYEFEMRVNNRRYPVTPVVHTSNGVHGQNALLRKTSLKFENVSYDMMHFLTNLNNYLIAMFKGEKGNSAASKIASIAEGLFPLSRYRNAIPRWKITIPNQKAIDSVCNTLLVPIGYAADFRIRFPMLQTGYMKAKEHMVFLMVYSNYFYSFTQLGKSYCNYIARLRSDLCRLFSPCLHIDELRKVVKSIAEGRALYEGLFPLSEQYFVVHQLIDIANNIETIGHIRGQTCFSGERSLATVGRFCPRFGLNYMFGLIYNYVRLEIAASMTNHTIPFNYLDNRNKYSDFVLKLYHPSGQYRITEYQKQLLLDSIINVLACEEIDDKEVKCSIHRIFFAHESMKTLCQLQANSKLYDWMTQLYGVYRSYNRTLSGKEKELSGILNGIIPQHCLSTVDQMNAQLTMGKLLLSDFVTIEEFIKFLPDTFSNVIVKGIRLTGRGVEFNEGSAAQRVRYSSAEPYVWLPNNDKNSLTDTWHKSNQYSSWCRYSENTLVEASRHQTNTDNRNNIQTKTAYGQLNYCFRLNIPSDPLIHGLGFANIAGRKTMYDLKCRHSYIESLSQRYKEFRFDGEKQFVCLNYIDSTALAVSALNMQSEPMCKPEKYSDFCTLTGDLRLNIAPVASEVKMLYLIELHPERLSYCYDKIETDKDGTKIWEAL